LSRMTHLKHRQAARVAVAKRLFDPFGTINSAVTITSPKAGADMRRREFLGAPSGAVVAWPPAAHAQQPAAPVGLQVPAKWLFTADEVIE
jgi:hypothetical protein